MRRTILIAAALVVALAFLVGGVLGYRHHARLESTDDAQIDGYIYPVTARVSGYVQRVTVDDEIKQERTATGVNAETFCFVKAA